MTMLDGYNQRYTLNMHLINSKTDLSKDFLLTLLNRSLEYCLDAFLQSVQAFIIVANSSSLVFPS